MNGDRDSRNRGAGRSPFPGGWAAATARGAWRLDAAGYVFETGMTNPAVLRAQLERLRPRPLKAQFSKTGRH